MDRTSALQCSYVEMVALGEQIAEWLVSHWWGDCVQRIWCIFELYKSFMDKKDSCKFDVYTEYDWEVNQKLSDGYYFKDNGDAISLID